MLQAAIKNIGIFKAGLVDNSETIKMLEIETDAIKETIRGIKGGDGVQHGRRKHDKVLAQQAEHRERCRQEVIKTLKCRS